MFGVALLLSGCSKAYIERSPGVPAEATDVDLNQVDPQPIIVWADDGKEWLLVTWGSTSCPSAPKSVTETGPNRFAIELAQEGGFACTADIGPTTFRLMVPPEVNPGSPVTVDIGPGVVEQELHGGP